jgi:hypothetical protein
VTPEVALAQIGKERDAPLDHLQATSRTTVNRHQNRACPGAFMPV